MWFQLNVPRPRERWRGAARKVVGVGIALLLASLIPGLFAFEVGLAVLVGAFVFLYRPDIVVRITGGPSKEWQALHDGRRAGGPRRRSGRAAGGSQRRGDRGAHRRPVGARDARDRDYLSLVRQTLFADPSDPRPGLGPCAAAAADAALRASLGARRRGSGRSSGRPAARRRRTRRLTVRVPGDDLDRGEPPVSGCEPPDDGASPRSRHGRSRRRAAAAGGPRAPRVAAAGPRPCRGREPADGVPRGARQARGRATRVAPARVRGRRRAGHGGAAGRRGGAAEAGGRASRRDARGHGPVVRQPSTSGRQCPR